MNNPIVIIKNKLSEVKGRTLLIVVFLVIILIVVIFYIFRPHSIVSGGTQAPGSSALRAPSIKSTPGVGSTNDNAYIELQREANRQKAEQAISQGKSAVATVTNDQLTNALSIPEGGIASIGGKKVPEQNEQQALAQYQQIYQEQLAKERQAEQERLMQERLKQEEVYQDAFEGLMQAQAKGLLNQWQPPSQTYVKTNEPEGTGKGGRGGANGSGSEFVIPPMYKAGDIIFGIMETSVDSDEPGPVLAKVVSGPLAGAKLIGSFKRVEAQLFLEFSLINVPDTIQSLPVKAVAIDPETARTALSTNVDYHRLLRYGTLFASSFLQGVGEAVLAGIQPDFTVDGSTFSVSDIQTSTKDQVLVGLGEVGTKLGEKLDPIFDKPPTVTLDAGTSVGLLFLQDFSLQQPASTMGATSAPAVQIIHEDATGKVINKPTDTAVSTTASQTGTGAP